jgi:hypothetical protein
MEHERIPKHSLARPREQHPLNAQVTVEGSTYSTEERNRSRGPNDDDDDDSCFLVGVV